MNYQEIINEVYREVNTLPDEGQVAQYIPELAVIDPAKFGVHLTTIDGQHYGTGDEHEKFSIQSIAKVLALTLAFQQKGDELWSRVGVEPSGNPFNSLWQLEYEKGKPRNPLINSGAIVICDIICSLYENPLDVVLDFVRKVAGNNDIHFNEVVAGSERSLGFRNTALINMMKASGNIYNDIDIGPEGMIGMEYTFEDVPITVFGEVSLMLELVDRVTLRPFTGVGARYRF